MFYWRKGTIISSESWLKLFLQMQLDVKQKCGQKLMEMQRGVPVLSERGNYLEYMTEKNTEDCQTIYERKH